MVFEHPGNVQVLKDHTPKPRGNPMAQLVMEFLASVGNPLMLDRDDHPGAGATFRAFGFSTQAALADFQSAFGLPQMIGWSDLLPGRENGEVFQPEVNADPIGEWGHIGDSDCALDGHIILAGLGFRHGAVLRCSLQGPMERDGNPADLWQIQRIPNQFEALRVADRLLVVLAFEAWILRTASKEVLVGPIQVLQRLL